MDGPPRRPPVLRQRSDSQGRALSPADSVTSLGGTRGPLLSWMFHHIRRENQDSLSKEDLRRLLGVELDNEQLDEAFENLDMDGDGRVSLDEFLGGFARFLLEAPTTPGKDRYSLLLEQRTRPSGRKRGSARRRLAEEECFESTDGTRAMNGAERPGENGVPAEKPSETFSESLSTLSSHNRHSIVTLWRGLADANPELLVDFEEFVGEVAEEVEHAQRALENQRRATKQEAMELDQEMESRLNAANTNLQIQTALTEVKTKLKLEHRLGDKEKELSAVKQKLQELETEVQAGQQAHTQLEEQFEALSQEKADLESRLEDREAILMRKHQEMERLNRQASENVSMHSSHIEETQDELQEIKREYEREISELKDKIMGYEVTHSVTSDDDEMILLSGQTHDFLSTMSGRHRHTSRHSLLEEIVKQEGPETPILRGEPLMPGPSLARPLCRASSLPDLFTTRQHLLNPIPYHASPSHPPSHPSPFIRPTLAPVTGDELAPPEPTAADRDEDHVTKPTGHVTEPTGHVTGDGPPAMATLDSPFSRARSLTVSGGGRPKIRPRSKPKKSPTSSSGQSHVMSRDSHVTPASDGPPLSDSQVVGSSVAGREEEEEEEEGEGEEMAAGRRQRDEQFIMKCQPLQFIENLATQPDYVFKILVVGNSYVGKSSFLMRLCTNAFSARYSSTIGVDFYSKALKVDDRIISLQLWDTAGQERFQSVTKAYYRGAQGVILMYDISQEESFIAVKSWINSIQENVDQMPTGLMLIGNKQDLEEQNEREVSTETGETFAKIYSAQFMETSAKTGFNVGNCLMNLVRTIKVYYEQDSSERRERGIQVTNKPKGSSCCGR